MMLSYRCMRLACRSRAQSDLARCSAAARFGAPYGTVTRSPYSSEATSGQYDVRNSSASKDAAADGSDGEVSAFKQQRLADLAKAQEGENPLITESYPRLQSTPDHMSNAAFRSRFAGLDEAKPTKSQIQRTPAVNPSKSSASTRIPPVSPSETRDRIPTNEEFEDGYNEAERETTVLHATLTGRVRAKRVVGSGLVFVDIVNDFQKVQVMINKKKVLTTTHRQAFKMWRNLIQIGDHICTSSAMHRSQSPSLTACL